MLRFCLILNCSKMTSNYILVINTLVAAKKQQPSKHYNSVFEFSKGWICHFFLLFCFIFLNAQRKQGGKFKYFDRCCNYFSSFVKIRDYVPPRQEGKDDLDGSFSLLSPFFLLLCSCPPLGHSSVLGPALQLWVWVCCWRLKPSLGHRVGGGSSAPCLSHCATAQQHTYPGQRMSRDPPQSHGGQLPTLPHLQKPHPESPSPSLVVCRPSLDLKLCPKVVPGLWSLSDLSDLRIVFPRVWFGKNYLTK